MKKRKKPKDFEKCQKFAMVAKNDKNRQLNI